MSAKALSNSVLHRLVEEGNFKEIRGEQGPFKAIINPKTSNPLGEARVFKGYGSEKLVYIGMNVESQLDSHMIFAFNDEFSPVPHFTLDVVELSDFCAYHLDLLPRVDLGVNLQYAQKVYLPLNTTYQEGKNLEGVSPAHLAPIQLAFMSPWMLANRATKEALPSLTPIIERYLDHWLTLRKDRLELDKCVDIPAQELSSRDKKHRSFLFSHAVDPVWAQVERIVGRQESEQLRSLLL